VLGRNPLHDGVAYQLSRLMNVQILHDAVLMELDGFRG